MAKKATKLDKAMNTAEILSVGRVLKCLIGAMVICSCMSMTGCAGLMVRHFEKGTKGTYSGLQNSVTPVPSGSGRLFVYAVEGGPNIMNTVGMMNFCTVDNQMYKIMGATYWFIDLRPGAHKVTVGGVNNLAVMELGSSAKYGKNAVEFDLKEGETKYCRIDIGRTGGFAYGALTTFTPTMIESSVGQHEMANLDSYNNFKPASPVTVE